MATEKICRLCTRRPASAIVDCLSAEVAAAGIVQAIFIVLEIACVAERGGDALEMEASARD